MEYEYYLVKAGQKAVLSWEL